MTLCSAPGPECPRCHAEGIYCLLPAGHGGAHKHPVSDGMAKPCPAITWPADTEGER